MANEQNLVPLSTEKAREIGKKGGVASGIAKRQKKTFKDLIEMVGEMKLSKPQIITKLKEAGLTDDKLTNDMAVIMAQYEKAQQGDTQAAQFVRDTKGESPKNAELNINADIKSITINFGNKKVVDGEEE